MPSPNNDDFVVRLLKCFRNLQLQSHHLHNHESQGQEPEPETQNHELYHFSSLNHLSQSILDFLYLPKHGCHSNLSEMNVSAHVVRSLVPMDDEIRDSGWKRYKSLQYISVGSDAFSLGHSWMHIPCFSSDRKPFNLISSKIYLKDSPVFCYGRVLLDHGRCNGNDAKVEGILAKQISKYATIVASCLRSLDLRESHSNILLHFDHPIHAMEVSYLLEDKLLGLRYLCHFFNKKRTSLGGEVYYLAGERSGGLSLGGRHIFSSLVAPHHVTTTWNPFMGHLSISNTQTLLPWLTASSRFDLNYYSYESDLTFGVRLQNPNSTPNPKIMTFNTLTSDSTRDLSIDSTRDSSRDSTINSSRDSSINSSRDSLYLRYSLEKNIFGIQFSRRISENSQITFGLASDFLGKSKTPVSFGIEIMSSFL